MQSFGTSHRLRQVFTRILRSILQQRHTGNTHHTNHNFRYQHDHDHIKAKEEKLSSNKEKQKENHSEMPTDITQKNAKCFNDGDRSDELLKKSKSQQVGHCSLVRNMEKRKKSWESKCGHVFMGAGAFAHKHGVGTPLNKKWKRKIIKTECVSERMISATMKRDQRKIESTSVCFSHSGYVDLNLEKMYKNIETICNNKNTSLSSRAISTLNAALE